MNSVERRQEVFDEIISNFGQHREFEDARADATRYARIRIEAINSVLDTGVFSRERLFLLNERSSWTRAVAESKKGKWRGLQDGIMLDSRMPWQEGSDRQVVQQALDRLGESIKPVIVSMPQMQRLRQRVSR